MLIVFSHGGSSRVYYAPYFFDVKTSKKTIELKDFPDKQISWLFTKLTNDGKQVLFFLDARMIIFNFSCMRPRAVSF